jgi:hypothetical protein
MVYVAIFDFALTGLTLAILGFLVWCWAAFKEDRNLHPIYRQSKTSVIHKNAASVQPCA